MINVQDYQEPGFLGSQEDGQLELQKAMQAGQITGRTTADTLLTQEPLKVESLENSVKLLEYRTKDIKLFNAIPKITAYNTVEEFMQLKSYGTQRGGFYDEGELSDVEDSQYLRKAELVKYMQITGEVTMQAQIVRSYVNAMRQETENKMMWIMRLANKSLIHADANVVPQQFNSIYKQHASIGSGDGFQYPDLEAFHNSDVVLDLRGKSMKQVHVELGAVRVDANFGDVDSLWAPTTVISALSQDYYDRQRILLGGGASAGSNGGMIQPNTTMKSISTTLGDVNLMSDKSLKREGPKKTTTPSDGSKAPVAPTTVTAALVADTLSKYGTTTGNTAPNSDTGVAYFAVASVNRYGESALTAFATPLTLAAGQSVTITITPGTGGAYPATGYVIYRTKSAAPAVTADFFPLYKVSQAELTAGNYDGAVLTNTVRDRGRVLPGMESAFLCAMNEEVMSFKQLAPLSKLDLAVLSMSRRFIVFMFGTPQVYAPKKIVRYINVSPDFQS